MSLRADFHNRTRRNTDHLTIAPLALDPLTALLARRHGFNAVYIGGGALGYELGVSEALLTPEDLAHVTRRITERVPDIAVIVDGGIGFGDAVHTRRTIQIIETAGACAIEIEDQVAPKRAHHHKGHEHLISSEDMCKKIEAACDARRDPDFLIIARCNAPQHEGIDAAIARSNAYAAAGADLLMLRGRDDDEIARITANTAAPLATLWAFKTPAEMLAAGYTLFLDAFSGTVVTYRALDSAFRALPTDRNFGISRDDITTTIEAVKDLIDLETLYAIERNTTEPDA
jgi:2-methylisocitrate lyase-like PEP mutase family enzyme